MGALHCTKCKIYIVVYFGSTDSIISLVVLDLVYLPNRRPDVSTSHKKERLAVTYVLITHCTASNH